MDNNFKNLLLTILFVIFIGTVFGFTFKHLQLFIISFGFGYYLSKRRLPQVYVKINDCIFRFKKIDSIVNSFKTYKFQKILCYGKIKIMWC